LKLFTKYNRVNIAATIVVFVIGSIGFYFVLDYVLLRQLDETLHAEQQEISSFVAKHGQLPVIQNTKHQWIEVQQTVNPVKAARLQTISVYNSREDESESIRQLIFPLEAGGLSYTSYR
jgi:two-component system sensor histidine kinase QseC